MSVELFGSDFLHKLERIELISRRVFRGKFRAERRAAAIGASLEFADYRNYSAGDDPRRIDWNLFGRLDRLFVKLFEEEEDLHVYLLVDCSRSMWMESDAAKFDHARKIAAALGYLALSNLDRVDVIPFASEPGPSLGLNRGKAQFHKVLEFLRRMPRMPGLTRMDEAMDLFVIRTRRRGLAVVLSDFLDPAGGGAGISRLVGAGFEVEAVQVLAPAEEKPPFSGDCLLVDAETGEEIEVAVDDKLLGEYQAARAARQQQLLEHCRKRGVSSIATSTAEPFEDLVLRRFLEAGFAA